MTMLDRVDKPSDLRSLDLTELDELAKEVRERIVETCAKNGGHVGPNLGAVELTLGLHRSFDAPRDKIIWDCSHQCYTHKLVTGRKDRFHTLRTHGGISGFCEPHESEYDTFGAGHTATSISAALGFAVARNRAKDDYYIVSVIGDGSITGGMAFEAINHVGDLRPKRFIIILNDNRLSLS